MKAKTQSPRVDVYRRVTERIVTDLEQGVRPWERPWRVSGQGVGSLPVRWDGTPYRGINVLLLWCEADERGFGCNRWMTYRQAKTLGGHVRKGQQGCPVVFADRITKTVEADNGEQEERSTLLMKSYTVFNVEQIEGLPQHFDDRVPSGGAGAVMNERAERFFAASGADFHYGGDEAFFDPSRDLIRLPQPESFRDAEAFIAVKAHELIHWTGHRDRLAREFGLRFGDDAYAVEELVAEMGAAFVCADLGVASEIRGDHAAYLAGWLAVLKRDSRAIFTAASAAQRAMDFLHGLADPSKAGASTTTEK